MLSCNPAYLASSTPCQAKQRVMCLQGCLVAGNAQVTLCLFGVFEQWFLILWHSGSNLLVYPVRPNGTEVCVMCSDAHRSWHPVHGQRRPQHQWYDAGLISACVLGCLRIDKHPSLSHSSRWCTSTWCYAMVSIPSCFDNATACMVLR